MTKTKSTAPTAPTSAAPMAGWAPSFASPEETMFLAGLVSEKVAKAARPGLTPGTATAVNLVLAASGSVRVGQPGEKRSTSTVLRKATMAILLRRLGVTREDTQRVLMETFSEALLLDKDAEEALLKAHPEVAAAFAHVEAIVDALPKTPTAAPVSVTVTSLARMVVGK